MDALNHLPPMAERPPAGVEMQRVSLVSCDVTHLNVDGCRIATFDHARKDVSFPQAPLTERQFQAILLGLLVVGTHWGYVSPDACDDCHMDLELRLGLLRPEEVPHY